MAIKKGLKLNVNKVPQSKASGEKFERVSVLKVAKKAEPEC